MNRYAPLMMQGNRRPIGGPIEVLELEWFDMEERKWKLTPQQLWLPPNPSTDFHMRLVEFFWAKLVAWALLSVELKKCLTLHGNTSFSVDPLVKFTREIPTKCSEIDQSLCELYHSL